jgi:sec-independent protein translocase protein TatA
MGLDNPLHIAFLVVILLLVFGAKRLPEIGRSLGTGMREFKDSVTGDSRAKTSQAALVPGPQPPQAVTPQPAADTAQVATEATAPSGPSNPA